MAVNKKALLAGALTMLLIFGAMEINRRFFSPKKEPAEQPQEPVPTPIQQETPWGSPSGDAKTSPREFTLETEVYSLTFSNQGGVLTGALLKNYTNSDGTPVELVFADPKAGAPFMTHLGNAGLPGVRDIFNYSLSPTGRRIEFSREVTDEKGNRFLLRKTYTLDPEAYLFRLSHSLEGLDGRAPYVEGDYLYTLSFGPQLGPFDRPLDNRNEFRYFTLLIEDTEKNVRAPEGELLEVQQSSPWVGIEGKYFTLLALPDNLQSTEYALKNYTDPILGRISSFYLKRQDPQVTRTEDNYTFYLGPKDKKILTATASHPWIAEKQIPLQALLGKNRALGWLNNGIAALLSLFYALIPNYGVAIILFSIFVKLLLIPLSNPVYLFHARMGQLKPEIESLNRKYQNDKGGLNQAFGELLARENLKPRSNLLVLFIQLPLFMALYTVLSLDIRFRQAVFIPGWISDITLPDALWDFSPFTLPVLGWQAVRVLPFLFLATILIQSRFTQSPLPGSRSMKVMSIFMPLFIFFILYELPAGVVLFFFLLYFFNLIHQIIVIKRYKAPS